MLQVLQTFDEVAPIADDHVGGEQGMQEAAPIEEDHVPAIQAVQDVDLALEYVDGMQAWHTVDEVAPVKVE